MDRATENRPDPVLLRRLAKYLRPHWALVSLAAAAMVIAAMADLAQPWITQQAIDRYIAQRDLDGLTRASVFFFSLLLAAFAAEFVQTYLLQLTAQRIMHTLRMQIYGRLQALDLKFYDRHPVGRLMTRVTTDVDALNDLFASGVVTVFGDVLVLSGIMIAMLIMDWRLALVAFTVFPFIAWVALWFRRNVRESYRQVRGLVARLNAFLQEHLTGMSTVQLFNQEERILARFDKVNREHRDANIASIFYYAVFYPVVEVLAAISLALILWVGGGWALDGAVSIGALVAFIQYSRRFFQPVSDLSEKFNLFQAAMAASERIFGVLDTPIEIVSPPQAHRPTGVARGRIEFEHVWFAYDDERFVLKDVSFIIEPGERIGVVGATGSGKTTLISLLLRFYEVSRGRILVDGIDVREWDLAELRAIFGLVLQDVHIFSGTIADNIRLGNASISDAEVAAAATAVHADRFITPRPDGYASAVAERGSTLSVGQRQLLSFARAVAFNPTILLLDEATSSIDTVTEALIDDALTEMMAGRTVLAIAHRLSTIQHMDRILVLHRGELRESGTHRELVAARGLYYRLYRLQYRDVGGEGAPIPPGENEPDPVGQGRLP